MVFKKVSELRRIDIYDRNKKKNPKETKEGLASDMLLNAFGNEESINQACDLIKELEIVEDYQ